MYFTGTFTTPTSLHGAVSSQFLQINHDQLVKRSEVLYFYDFCHLFIFMNFGKYSDNKNEHLQAQISIVVQPSCEAGFVEFSNIIIKIFFGKPRW